MTQLPLPLPQSPEFARACAAMGHDLRIFQCETDLGRPISWQIQSRKLPVLGRVDLVSRGPVAPSAADQDFWLSTWRQRHDGRPLILNADGLSAQNLIRAGFWPLMTPASLAMLPLDTPNAMRARLRQKWRNRLNRAEAEAITITRQSLSADHWLLTAEMAQARSKGYRGLPPALSAAFASANPGQAVVFEARHKAEPIAAALVLRHGRMATWQIGHSTELGRKMNAMNLVLWRAMTWLSARDHSCLDLGMLNHQDAAGLSHFKLGTGAETHRLGGTWLHQNALAPIARRLPLRMAA